MNEKLVFLLAIMEESGRLAPFIFIFFHTLRQFLFIPAALVIMAGGVLFGSLLGTVYSLIGLMILSALFYLCIGRMPKTYEKLMGIKSKWFGRYHKMTVGQISVLRLIPFFHYHLLNLCLRERHPDFRGYMRGAFVSNLPLAFFYTVFGEFITRFTPAMAAMIVVALFVLFYVLREKIAVIAWKEFFAEGN